MPLIDTRHLRARGVPHAGPEGPRLKFWSSEPIVVQVSSSRFSTGGRATALFALSALLVVLLGATGGIIADPDAGGEPCVGCAGCETGECAAGDENPLTSHHHCCTTCCMSHAPLALATVISAQAPAIAEPMPARTSVAVTGRSPETPDRPPRV